MTFVVIAFSILSFAIGALFQYLVDRKEIKDTNRRYLKTRDKLIEATSYTVEVVNQDFKKMQEQKKLYEVQAQELVRGLKTAEFSVGVYKTLAQKFKKRGNKDVA